MELAHRREAHVPPYASMVRVVLRGTKEREVDAEARRLGTALLAACKDVQPPIRFQGPCPAPVRRLEAFFRFHLQMICDELTPLLDLWKKVGVDWKLAGDVELAIDVEPLNLR